MNLLQRSHLWIALFTMALFTVAGAQPPGAGAEKVDLRPRWEQGAAARYVMTIRSDNMVKPIDKAEPEQKQTIEQEFTLSMKAVKADPENGATVEIIYERVKVHLKTDDIDLNYDSDGSKPVDPKKSPRRDQIDEAMDEALKQAFAGMVGQRMTVVYDGQGNIKSVDGGVGLALPGLMDKAGAGMGKDAAASLFGPISTRKSGGGLVGLGEKWKNIDDVDLTPMGQFRMVTDYQLRSTRDGKADVVFTGRIEAPTEVSGKSPVAIKGGGYRGQYTWDTRLGQLKSMTSEQQVTIEGQKGGIGSMSSTQTVKVERVERRQK